MLMFSILHMTYNVEYLTNYDFSFYEKQVHLDKRSSPKDCCCISINQSIKRTLFKEYKLYYAVFLFPFTHSHSGLLYMVLLTSC